MTESADVCTEKEKVYETVLLLGTTTDTQDLTGKKLHICEMIPKQEKVLSVLEQFIGTYEQIPPMYSAIKVGGKKLYELAREGKEIERTPRKVNIQNIEIIQISEKEVSMRVFQVVKLFHKLFLSPLTYYKVL